MAKKSIKKAVVPLTQAELDAFNVELNALCIKHGVSLKIEGEPKLVAMKR